MASIKYYYNPETCKYEPIVLSAKQKIFRGALFAATSLVTGFFALWLYSFVFESPTEALLRKENASLKFYYKLLNKEFTFNENIRKRFLAEAKSMFRMSHPNVIKVTDLIDEDVLLKKDKVKISTESMIVFVICL